MSRPTKDAGLGRSRGRRIFDPFRAESDSAFDPRKRRLDLRPLQFGAKALRVKKGL